MMYWEFQSFFVNLAPVIEPGKQALTVAGFLLPIVGVTLEVLLLRVFCRVLHADECDTKTTVKFTLLNFATWFGLLFPIIFFLKSVLLAEIVVVVVEAYVLCRIFKLVDVNFDLKRGLIYSFVVNMTSYLAGVLTRL